MRRRKRFVPRRIDFFRGDGSEKALRLFDCRACLYAPSSTAGCFRRCFQRPSYLRQCHTSLFVSLFCLDGILDTGRIYTASKRIGSALDKAAVSFAGSRGVSSAVGHVGRLPNGRKNRGQSIQKKASDQRGSRKLIVFLLQRRACLSGWRHRRWHISEDACGACAVCDPYRICVSGWICRSPKDIRG